MPRTALVSAICLWLAGAQIASAQTFSDVPTDHWAHSYVEILVANGVTGGCGNNNYCPEDKVTRAQMAVFLERGMRGSSYTPPPASGNLFLDVSAQDFGAAWIEQLYLDGITGGCGGNDYCPGQAVTRAQMAVFLLRAKHGAAYTPPTATGLFGDVDLSHWAVHWVEALAAEGITGGCGGGNYCPDEAVTRAQMAVFLVRAFGLVIPPPVNSAPTAEILVSKITGYAPLTVVFDGTSSSDSDGSISTYEWQMGDGGSYQGAQVTHTYNGLGSFTSTLTVTDNDGASSSSTVTIDVYAQAVGPWYGDICSYVTAECVYVWGIIASDHRFYFNGYDYALAAWNREFGGTIGVEVDYLEGVVLAETVGDFFFLDGSQVGDVAVGGTVTPKATISGSYAGVGDSGTVEVYYNTPVDGTSSLDKLAGTWSVSDGQGYTSIMVVDADGSFTETDTLGCVVNGRFSLMDERRNEYDIEYDLTCPDGVTQAGNGFRKGVAFIDDYFEANITLYYWVTFQDGPLVGHTGWGYSERPRVAPPLASGQQGVSKASSFGPLRGDLKSGLTR
jgi:PKD repeat protein